MSLDTRIPAGATAIGRGSTCVNSEVAADPGAGADFRASALRFAADGPARFGGAAAPRERCARLARVDGAASGLLRVTAGLRRMLRPAVKRP